MIKCPDCIYIKITGIIRYTKIVHQIRAEVSCERRGSIKLIYYVFKENQMSCNYPPKRNPAWHFPQKCVMLTFESRFYRRVNQLGILHKIC